MTMISLILIGTIPALLVVLTGLLILHVGSDLTAGRRFLRYLLVVSGLLLPVVFVIAQITPEHDTRLTNQILTLIAPSLLGVLALILVNFKLLAQLRHSE